uniref:ABC transporter domain-containing protein n=1 Tax=Globisporangium ultimum (strain ATCC 200006 / CBS 805.95 / DAOM BR144) TaxID=431595 RepID=K3WE64_GLOUD
MGACFYFLTTASPNTTVAIPITLVVVLVNVTFAGFVIPKDRIPVYLVWLYWLTPMSWCIRGVMVNQYRSPEFTSCEYANIDYCTRFKVDSVGEYVLSLYDVPSGRVWIFGGMLYMIALTALLMAAATYVLEYRRFETPEQPTLKRDASLIHPSSTTSTTNSATISPHTPRERDGNVTVIIKPLPEKSFVPLTLAFQDLYYAVPLKTKSKDQPTSIDLLKGVSGFAKPGTMTAPMGSSGAGKTTLMDVIAGRKTGGTIRGKIFVNGYEATDTVIRRCAGYCEQMDVRSEASTFREALTFSAFLRQPSDVPDCVKFDSVYECLDLLDLHPIAKKIIRGSSMEQMKRLTIGVELAAQPSVLFLDESTSGLDAQAAKSIMAGVRDVANTGRTVMCTIHQPSTAVFEVFDNLLLLKKGGEMVYFGEIGDESRSLIMYFESIPGILRMERGANPATWMLECIGVGVGGGASASSPIATDFMRIFQRSALKQSLDRHLSDEGVTRPSPRFTELRYSNKRAASELMQLRFLLCRTMATYWRTASYNLTRIVIATAIACVFAAVFAGAEYTTYQGINGGVSMVFLSTVFCGIVSFFSVLPVAFAERASFYRERASQAYNALWYFFALSMAEIPYVLGSSLVFTLIFYPSVGFTGFHTGLLYWLNTALLTLMQTYTGQLVAFALPSEQLALLVSVLLNTIFFLFMGFNPPVSAVPSGFRWLNHVVPKRYSFSILTALVFADCPADDDDSNALGCQPLVGAPPTMQPYANVREYVESVFGARHDDIARNVGVVLLAIVVIRVLGLLALRFVNHQKR